MPIPPLDFLLECSMVSLQDLELSAMSRSANFAKQLRVELDMWVEETATAMLARWLQENRDSIREMLVTVDVKPKKAELFESRAGEKTA